MPPSHLAGCLVRGNLDKHPYLLCLSGHPRAVGPCRGVCSSYVLQLHIQHPQTATSPPWMPASLWLDPWPFSVEIVLMTKSHL